jgi:hypothetical protein
MIMPVAMWIDCRFILWRRTCLLVGTFCRIDIRVKQKKSVSLTALNNQSGSGKTFFSIPGDFHRSARNRE